MRRSKFTEEQIVAALKLAEGSSVDEVCRKIGISRFHGPCRRTRPAAPRRRRCSTNREFTVEGSMRSSVDMHSACSYHFRAA